MRERCVNNSLCLLALSASPLPRGSSAVRRFGEHGFGPESHVAPSGNVAAPVAAPSAGPALLRALRLRSLPA